MAKNRVPGGISSIEFRVWVKDPDAAANTLFGRWVQVPGTGGVTMPAEEAAATDELTLEGPSQATGFASPGTITVPLPRLTQHPAHRLLIAKQSGQGSVLIKLHRRAVGVAVYDSEAQNNTISGAVANPVVGADVITGIGNVVFPAILPGHYVSLADAAAGDDELYDFDDTPMAGDDDWWRAVVAKSDNDQMITVAPGFNVAVAAAADLLLTARQPGLQYTDLTCQVGTMARGEAAGSASIAGSLVLRPDSGIGTSAVVLSTAELAAVHA